MSSLYIRCIDSWLPDRHNQRMTRTRVFKSGNSLAVRLPKELAFREGAEVEICREGDVVTIAPARLDMATFVARLRELAESNPKLKRRRIEPPERDWSLSALKR